MPTHLVQSIFGNAGNPETPRHSPETLVAESHHRVANSLTLISGLVRLHARNVAGRPQALSTREMVLLLEEIAGRVDTVARLHRLLTDAEAGQDLDLGEYVREVARAISSSLSAGTERPELFYELDDGCRLPSRHALPIGLIVGEVVTNAIKYAHPTGIAGRITVACHRTTGGELTLQIVDDGVGLPEGFDPKMDGGLGLRLIDALAQQIGATTVFRNTGLGLSFQLLLPAPHDT